MYQNVHPLRRRAGKNCSTSEGEKMKHSWVNKGSFQDVCRFTSVGIRVLPSPA